MHLFESIETHQVFILTKDVETYTKNNSLARIYMNRFAIEEDDHFEIHVKDYTNKDWIREEEAYNATEEVIVKAQQGSGYNLL